VVLVDYLGEEDVCSIVSFYAVQLFFILILPLKSQIHLINRVCSMLYELKLSFMFLQIIRKVDFPLLPSYSLSCF